MTPWRSDIVRWPSRLGALAVAAISLLCAASAGAETPAAPSTGTGRLNVVFIVSDDENVSGSAVMADVHRLLARHGVTFDDFRVTTSECGPSRASILTGLYSHHSGVLDNFGPHSYPAFDESSDLAVWLHQAGYSTALVGKYLNDYTLDGHHVVPPGWTDWQAIDSVPEERYYDYTLNENGRRVRYGGKPADYSTTVLTGKAVSFLKSVRNPFFLYFAPVAPHLPAVPAPADVGRFDKLAPFSSPSMDQPLVSDEPWARWHDRAITAAGLSYIQDVRRHQLEALQAVDRGVARIVSTLAHRRLLDRTVIFYTSDNGFLWGEHRLGGKIWPYEESTRVPLVVRTPWAHGATVSHAAVLNIDFASTISELAGIVPGGPQDGDSFVPLLHGEKVRWRHDYLIEYLGKNKLDDGGPPPYVAIHTPRYLYVEYRYRHWRELYDLRTDPWELRNAVDEPGYRGVVAVLSERLKDLLNDPAHAAPEREALART
jgi:N-acetylglucosamine-6-sulfatase